MMLWVSISFGCSMIFHYRLIFGRRFDDHSGTALSLPKRPRPTSPRHSTAYQELGWCWARDLRFSAGRHSAPSVLNCQHLGVDSS